MKKRLLLVLTLVLAATMLFGVSLQSFAFLGKKKEKKVRIAVVSKGYQHEFWRTVELGTLKAAEEFNVETNFIGPDKESETGKQVGMVENAINRKVDAVVLAAVDANALRPVARKVVDAGIVLVAFDSDVADDISMSFIATDNVAAGELAGKAMAEAIGYEGKVAIVAHNAGTHTAIAREKGFRNIMEQHPDIKVLNTQYSDGDRSRALAITQDIVLANPDLKGVYGTNEGAAVGVARAIEEKGAQDRVVVIGFDSSDAEINFINKGVMKGMVVQNPFMMGYLSVKTAVELIEGKEVEPFIDTGAVYVTKDNIGDPEVEAIIYPFGKD